LRDTTLAKLATNIRPDLLIFHAIGNWIFFPDPTKNFLPLDGMSFIKMTSPEIIKDGDEYQGHVWAATLGFPTIDGMPYNVKDFAKAGTPVPRTYAGIVRACQAIKAKEAGVAPIYVAANGTDDWTDQVFPFEMWNSALEANPSIIRNLDVNKGSFGAKPFVRGFAELADLEKMGCFNPNPLSGTYALQQKAIFTGSAAMIFQLTSVIPSLVATYGESRVNKDLGFTGVSQTDGVCSWQTTASSENVFISNTGNTAKEAVARAFIQYATTTGYGPFVRQSQTYPLLSGYSSFVDKAAIPLPEQEAEALFAKSSVPQYQQQLLAN
jgi:hypothetical protein